MNELFNYLVAYLELAIKFLLANVMTMEGIFVIFFGMFFLGLVSKIRS